MRFFEFKKSIEVLPPEGLKQLPNSVAAFMWFFLRQIKTRFFVLMGLGVVAGILGSTTSYFFGQIVQAFVDTPPGAPIMQQLMWPMALYVSLVLVCVPVLYNSQGWLSSKTLPYFTGMVRRQLALYLHSHSYRYFQDDFAGRLAGKVLEMPNAMRQIVSDVTGAFVYAIITFLTSFAIFCWVGKFFALVTFLYLFGYALNMRYFVGRIRGLSTITSRKRSVMRGRYVDIISNVFLVKIFARAQHEDSYFRESVHGFAAAATAEEIKVTQMFRVQHVLNSSFMFFLLVAIIHGWQAQTITTAQIAMVFPMAFTMVQAAFWLTEIYTGFFERLGEVEEGMEAIVSAHDVTDIQDAPALKVTNPVITFEDVNFSYPSRPMFENFSLHIPAHQRVGLVGPSGAGKSTLMQILLRLHDVQGGAIKIDGQNIARVSQDSLRESIGFIPQSADLLHRTVRENIAYGKPDASEADIIAAAKAAEAHDFICNLRDATGGQGYDAAVGERGVKLSGGQRQRLAIARAILKDASIIVLDEATSSLDSESERLIQESLKNLMKGRTVLAIAHRLSTIAHLDRLIVMGAGKIVEDGTHTELLAKGGLYARLWNLQSGGFIA